MTEHEVTTSTPSGRKRWPFAGMAVGDFFTIGLNKVNHSTNEVAVNASMASRRLRRKFRVEYVRNEAVFRVERTE